MAIPDSRVTRLLPPINLYGLTGSPRRFLLRLKRLALRRRVWYEALTLAERGIVELTARCVESVKSSLLRKTLEEIVARLAPLLESRVLKRVLRRGLRLAHGMVQAAVAMGYEEAWDWLRDEVYVRFLGVRSCHCPL
ncbi:MAG: hypothetical protein ACE5KH_06705 [Candidatus Geothermarchaeales archaeon]